MEAISESGLTLSPGDSHVRTFPMLDSGLDLQEQDQGCGASSLGSFARFDHDTFSWRTYQRCLDGEWERYSQTWPQAGTMRNGACFRVPSLECRTKETACLSLPTPTKSMGQRGWGLSRSGRRRYSEKTQNDAWTLGYKPPPEIVEWMMGFPHGFTLVAWED